MRRGRDTVAHMHRGKATWGHSEEAAVCKPRREVSGGTNPADTWISDFQPRTVRSKFLLFTPQPVVLGYGSPTKQYKELPNLATLLLILRHSSEDNPWLHPDWTSHSFLTIPCSVFPLGLCTFHFLPRKPFLSTSLPPPVSPAPPLASLANPH